MVTNVLCAVIGLVVGLAAGDLAWDWVAVGWRRVRRGGPRTAARHAAPKPSRAPVRSPELAGWQRALVAEILDEFDSLPAPVAAHGRWLADTLRRQADDVADLQLAALVLVIIDYFFDALEEIEPSADRQGAVIGQLLAAAVVEMTAFERSLMTGASDA